MAELDPELQAMSRAAEVINKIDDPEARVRVVEWLMKKFEVSTQLKSIIEPSASRDSMLSEANTFDLFSDLYDAANPSKNVVRALVGGYWLQVLGGQQTWDSFSVNKLLKDAGYGINSISHTLSDAQNQTPALVRQASKSGRSRQARKTYRLTQAGIKYVENLLDNQGNE